MNERHDEIDDAVADAARITMSRVPCNLPLSFHCDYSMGSVGEMIWENARRDSE
jgi:hypothetical protein